MQKNSDEELEKLRKSITEQLWIIRKAVDDNTKFLYDHYEKYDDLYMRKKSPDSGEEKTDAVHQPLAAQFRLEIKSLLECLSIIDQKLNKGDSRSKAEEEDEEEVSPKEKAKQVVRGQK